MNLAQQSADPTVEAVTIAAAITLTAALADLPNALTPAPARVRSQPVTVIGHCWLWGSSTTG